MEAGEAVRVLRPPGVFPTFGEIYIGFYVINKGASEAPKPAAPWEVS